MFVRTRKQIIKDKEFEYAYLVKNEWNPFRKKHIQKIVASLGRKDRLPVNGTIEKMILALNRFATEQGFTALSQGIVLENLTDEKLLSDTYDWGSLILVNQILRSLSLDKILISTYQHSQTKKINQTKFLTSIAVMLARRFYPRNDTSELETSNWYDQQLFLPDKTPLSHMDFYRSLDILFANKDDIEKSYYEQNLNLFNGSLDLVLFDTTSIYYWGASGDDINYQETDLLQYGFSKDGKGDLKQLIVGVLMTTDGVPIAHEVFPGNTADVHAFSKIITVIKTKYRLNKVILVADRGMVSEENLIHLEQSKLSYVVGIKMRGLSDKLKQKLLFSTLPQTTEDKRYELDDLDKIADNLYAREFKVDKKLTEKEIKELFVDKILKLKTATFDYNSILELIRKRRFFICLNPYVREADRKKRKYFTKVIENKIRKAPIKEWIIKNGYKKYLKFEKGLSPTIDYDRLKDEEIYDGRWILMTNEEHISSYMAGTYYKTLQNIERGFRDLKSLITVQPIFHWKERRMQAHIFVCFLSLILKWYICRTFNKYTQKPGRRFIEEMLNLKAIAVDKTIPVYARTAISPQLQEQMKQLNLKVPPRIIMDKRLKSVTPNPKGGRPRKVDPNQFKLPFPDS